MKLARPLAVVGDIHLAHGGSPETAGALARLVETTRGSELVLNGDVFNLSLDPRARDPIESVLGMLAPHDTLRLRLREKLSAGEPVTLVPGNHDADVARSGMRDALLAWLEVGERAPLDVVPWLVRRGGVHVEHGHVYDPDNAPTHPLVPPAAETEPLGVALTRRFLAPNQAFEFAHATEVTPVRALERAVKAFGARTPLLLARYFTESGRFVGGARWRPELLAEKRTGDLRMRDAARAMGLDEAALRALDEDRPRPTHESFERAFFRLYFDRVVAATSAGVGAVVGLTARSGSLLGLGVLGALYLYESTRRGTNRYEGLPVKRLRAAADRVRALSHADLVIFGHTHVPEMLPGYLNPGSFQYRAGARPYAYVNEAGEGERRTVE
ncbi:MAG TPA: metallophosphoesterase [Polyangiaceae bacterium]